MGQTKTDSFVDYCTLKFKPGPAGQTQEVEVVAKRDFVDDGNQKMFLKLFIPDHVDPVDWNCHKQITDVEVSFSFFLSMKLLYFFCFFVYTDLQAVPNKTLSIAIFNHYKEYTS